MKEEKSGRSGRITYIDLYRAGGILLMIMGHVGFGNAFDKWIHAFHIPMFFFASGWFFSEGASFSARLKKKTRNILVPYFFFGLFELLLLLPFIEEYRSPEILRCWLFENTASIPAHLGSLHISPVPGALWFLTAFFFCELIYAAADGFLGLTWKLHVFTAAMVCAGMAAPRLLPFRLPWALDAAFAGMGFYHAARCIRKYDFGKITKWKLWQTLLLLFVFSIFAFLSPMVNMRTGEYGLYLPFLINGAVLSAAGWNLAGHLERLLEKNRFLMIISRWMQGVGRNSIVYLCLNQIVILAVNNLTDLLGIRGMAGRGLILIISMIILYGLEKLVCGTGLRRIIGR